MSSRTLYGCVIFLRRECHSVCFLCEVSYDLKERMGRTDFTLFSYLYVSAGIFDSLEQLFRRRIKRLVLEFSRDIDESVYDG